MGNCIFQFIKSWTVERVSWCKGITLEVKLVGRFKVFLRDSCVKKLIYFSEKLVHIK